jgi:hypothetical protein
LPLLFHIAPNLGGNGGNMKKFVKAFAFMAVGTCSPAMGAASCPAHQPGAPYPWSVEGHFSGDQWADVELDLDAKGKATACRIFKSNMSREDNFWVCGAMQVQGQYDPVTKDGIAVPGTIKTKMVVQGMRHREANASARKRWFKEHPEERWDCYPE